MINPNPFSTLWVSFLGRDKPTKSSIVLLTVSIQTALKKAVTKKTKQSKETASKDLEEKKSKPPPKSDKNSLVIRKWIGSVNYHKLPKETILVTFGMSRLWGSLSSRAHFFRWIVTFGEQTTLYQVGAIELF